MSQTKDNEDGGDLALKEAKPKLKKPPMYQVILINDDYTPMEFVVHVLVQFFAKDPERAHAVMMEVHTRGRGICGSYPRDIAETKVSQVNTYSRQNQHPLLCVMEPI